ncbi:MAG TPA: S53 family peptidase [Steroidobacteraceae bacterium]
MKKAAKRMLLPGSVRKLPRGTRLIGPAPSRQRIQVTLRLRSRRGANPLRELLGTMAVQSPRQREYLSRREYAERFGADPADVALIEAFAHAQELTVVRVDLPARIIRLEGTVAALSAAFGVRLGRARLGGVQRRLRRGPVFLPPPLRGIVLGVHGLDDRPVARPHFRRLAPGRASRRRRPGARASSEGGFLPPAIARLYDFPAALSGAGQCIAIIELNDLDGKGQPSGAGYRGSDLQAFFAALGIAVPAVAAVGIDGGANLPGHSAADGEVVLDIEVAGAIAPGARLAVYFAPNTTSGFIDAVNAAVHDDVRRPSVISISWGGPEDPDGQTAPQFLDGLNEAIEQAAAMGVTVCVAAGDNGSADMSSGWDGKPHVDFPASSPYAVACGGTTLAATAERINTETVWNDGPSGGATGGGISNYFARPSYQDHARVPKSPVGFAGRGLPDLAGDADPNTGYRIFLDGKWQLFGGTSAVAPLMAALLALINEQLQKQFSKTAGHINPIVYGPGSAAFRDITSGNNDLAGTLRGEYSAGPGWDACSGMGVPDGARLLRLLSG